MARYDRIERLPVPDRAATFDAWPAVADLAGNERDSDLGRRARLRFLALRPVHRLLRRGRDSVPTGSLNDQVRSVREELGQLGARDPERTRLGELLTAVADDDIPGLLAAIFALGRIAEERRHRSAAEEWFLVGATVASRHHLHGAEGEALRSLAELAAADHRLADADRWFEQAAAAAPSIDGDWARGVIGRARIAAAAGNDRQARRLLREALERGREHASDPAVGLASAALCAMELDAVEIDAALEHGWLALRALDGDDRIAVLFDIGRAFRMVAMRPAADACYDLIAASGTRGQRARARAEQALTAAEAGDPAGFDSRRGMARSDLDGLGPAERARVLLRLGRGALRTGATDDASIDLREAVSIADDRDLPAVVREAEELISALEQATSALLATPEPHRAGPVARQVAAEVAALAGPSG